MKTNIIVKFDLEGTHSWPNAPNKYIELRAVHGHIFHFEVHIPVREGDRELEFLEARRLLMEAVIRSYSRRSGGVRCDFRNYSCEMIAKSLGVTTLNILGVTPAKVVVMEDAFVGAEVLK